MTKKHKTSINYLKLPIFTGSRNIDTSQTKVIEYEENDVKSIVEIQNGNLSNYHRKLFLCLEYLFIKQNPTFKEVVYKIGDKEEVRSDKILITSFNEIREILNSKSKNYKQIIDSIRELQRVNITSTINKKVDNNIEKEMGSQFNLINKVRWITNINKKDNNTRIYTGEILIEFQDFHIQNLKSNYYRLINFELVRRLSNNSVRFFDYLNLNSYYQKEGTYRQKKKVKFEYKKLVEFLLLKYQDKNSYRERQFEKQLKELKEKGVIKSYEWEHDFFSSFLHINLSQSINLWGTYNPKQIDNVEKLTPVENKLKEYGVPPKQREFLVKGFSEEYINNKLEQYEYITKNIPHKIRGRGSYIYNSIKDDWIDDSFTEYKEKNKQKELKIITKKEKNRLEELHNEYEEYINSKCMDYIKRIMTEEEKKEIDILVYEKVKNYKFLSTDSSKSFYEEIERINIVKNRIDLPDYNKWLEIHKE